MSRTLPILLVLLTSGLTAQQSTVELTPPFGGPVPPFIYVWDNYRPGLIVCRDTALANETGVVVYDPAGRVVLAVKPIRDLSDDSAHAISIWAAAGTPDKGVALATVVSRAGKKGVRHLILVYDGGGRLRKVWDMFPYHHHALAVDSSGNVYGFGHRVDSAAPKAYSLLVKYSPSGRVAAELFPSTLLPSGKSIDDVVEGGVSKLVLDKSGAVVLYMSSISRLIAFAHNGRIERDVDLIPLLSRIALGHSAPSAVVTEWNVSPDGVPWFQLTLQLPQRRPREWVLAQLAGTPARLTAVASSNGIGAESGGQTRFLSRDERTATGLLLSRAGILKLMTLPLR